MSKVLLICRLAAGGLRRRPVEAVQLNTLVRSAHRRCDEKESHMAIYALGAVIPEIAEDAYVHPDAVVIGAVTIGSESSIWPGAVLRGDYTRIEIGARTSIQDGTIVHVGHDLATSVGDDCVVGHNAYLEGCIVEDHVLVGSMSVLLHNVIARSRSVIGAGAVVQAGTEIPSQAMALGVPAKIRLEAASGDYVSQGISGYIANGARYRAELRRIG